jgi:hypothetical protein
MANKSPFGNRPFGTVPFGPEPTVIIHNANISIGASAVGEGTADAVGEAEIAFEADSNIAAIENIVGESAFEIAADGVGAFSRTKVRVITTAPFAKRGVSSLSRPTIAASQHSGRSRTGLSHTGLN